VVEYAKTESCLTSFVFDDKRYFSGKALDCRALFDIKGCESGFEYL